MKYLFLFPLLATASFELHGQDEQVNTYVLEQATIAIHGQTNVNEFTCRFEKYAIGDILGIIGYWNGESISFKGLKLRISLDDFDCGLRMMTNDFRDLLKSEEYPYLTLDINQIFLPPSPDLSSRMNVTSTVAITIAGATNQEQITNSYLSDKDGKIRLGAAHTLSMINFDIEPPTKFFGTVVVQEELDITFEVLLAPKQ